MNLLLISIFLLAAPSSFAADAPKDRPARTITIEDEDLKRARRARMSEIAAIEKATAPARAAALRSLLSDKDPLVRGEAAEAMGRSKDAAAFRELSDAVKSEDQNTRWGAVLGLAELGDRRAVPSLIAALGHKDKITRWKSAQALGVLKDPRAVEPLINAADSDKNREVRLAAIEALLAIGGPRALSALEALSRDPDPEVGAWASAAAAKLR